MDRYYNSKDKVPFYYRLFGRFVDRGDEKINSKQLAEMLGFKSANSVVRDFKQYIEAAGNLHYGYNNVFMYNSFKKLMQLDGVVNVAILGEDQHLFNNDECSRRGFQLLGILEDIDTTLIEQHNIRALIITDRQFIERLSELPDSIRVVINMTGVNIDDENLCCYVENVDICKLLTNAWYYSNHIGEED